MAAFLPDPWIVDAIIALVAVEGIVLVVWRALTGGGLTVVQTLANLSSGAALLLALRMVDHRRPVSVCSGIAVGCAHRSCRRSREPVGGGLRAAFPTRARPLHRLRDSFSVVSARSKR